MISFQTKLYLALCYPPLPRRIPIACQDVRDVRRHASNILQLNKNRYAPESLI